jgi:hypothetical protein
MKLIDKTPFYDEKGEISFLDRAKAFMEYGRSWIAEMEAQKSVLPMFEKLLDNKYTLMRNITPPGLDAPIPFILVGPPGIYVLYVTPQLGMFRAKGDQWGTISGNAFKPEKTNLLTRTERMARAVQVHLQRQGYSELTSVEAILLCANPSVHVDSLRPIVRIVMRDALERFIVSIVQARVVFSPEMVYDVINRIMNPPTPKEETPAPEPEEMEAEQSDRQDVIMSEEYTPPSSETPFVQSSPEPWNAPAPEFIPIEEGQPPIQPLQAEPLPRKKKKVSKAQWLFLAFMALIWLIMMGIFIYLVVQDMFM